MTEKSGLFISFDKLQNTLSIYQHSLNTDEIPKDFCVNFNEFSEINTINIETTLGQLIMCCLHRVTDNGLPFGSYESIFHSICIENLTSIYNQIDFTYMNDQYDYATLLFSHGRKMKSWQMIENALSLFEQSATAGNIEAKRFLNEDLPVVLPRLKEKLNP